MDYATDWISTMNTPTRLTLTLSLNLQAQTPTLGIIAAALLNKTPHGRLHRDLVRQKPISRQNSNKEIALTRPIERVLPQQARCTQPGFSLLEHVA